MYTLNSSEVSKIVLPILFTIQFIAVLISGYLLIKQRNIFPIKQLSPRLTLLILVSIIITSIILLVCKLTDIHTKNNGVLALMSVLYVFFREFIIIAFYMRCLRICAAYFNTSLKLIIAVFSRQFVIALVAGTISAVFAITQAIQYIVHKDVNKMTNFFIFYIYGDASHDPLNFFPIWSVDNVLFFVVLILSLKVHERFKFVKLLLASCFLFHVESFYSIVILFCKTDTAIQLKLNFEYLIMGIHIVFIWILLTTSLRPNQYQHPLPIQNNLSYPNTAVLDKQTFLIISDFVDQLEIRSMAEEERNRNASTLLINYTTFKIAQRKIAQIQLQDQSFTSSQIDDEVQIRNILQQFVYNQVVPNLNIDLIRDASVQLFNEGQQMSQETIRTDLQIQHFRRLNKMLDNAIAHSFIEWKKTKSFLSLKEQFRNNSKIITTMTKLNIGI